MDQVKMQIPAANGPKDARILLALSLAKQPPRGPFARELRNQTGGNKSKSQKYKSESQKYKSESQNYKSKSQKYKSTCLLFMAQ